MRIRSIKPEFWTSEDVAALSWPTRLLFIGLWSYVDDNGVGRDNEKLIKADLFPLEDDPREALATVSRGLQDLSEGGQITRYTVDGKAFLYVNAWGNHQRIDKPNKARYPDLTCGNAIIRDTLATPSRASRETLAPGTEEQGNRGTGEDNPSATPVARELDRFDEFWETYGKKHDRKGSERLWAAALKKRGVTADLLISAAAAYVLYERTYNEGGRFVMDPAKWLRNERWRDERRPAPPQTRVQQHMALVRQLGNDGPDPFITPREIGPA